MGNRKSCRRRPVESCQPLYLGDDLEEIQGRTIHDDETVLTLPLLIVPDLVLCPGQVVPLQLFQTHVVAMMRRVIDADDGADNTFGLVASTRVRPSATNATGFQNIGTTAEVLAYKTEEDAASGIRHLSIKAIGRQRFKVNETRRTVDGCIMGHVSILPEFVLPDPFAGVRPKIHQHGIVQRSSQHTQKVDRLSTANLTHWPAFVYRQYDVEYLMQKVRKELAGWNLSEKGVGVPNTPVEMSFWLASNLPLPNFVRLRLLAINSAVMRLRAEISIMKQCTALCCRRCNALITKKTNVFSMALEGPMSAYVNPNGFVHETLTVTKAHNLDLIGRPSTENSWFPGYAWTIVQCHDCYHHLGWRFTATNRSLKPQKFWGLTRSGLMPGLVQSRNPPEAGDSESSGSLSTINDDSDNDDQWHLVM